MWSPADSYCLRYYDEDSGNEIWNINSSGLFSGKVSWDNITSKPSTFTPSSHTHDYLPSSGGTLSGSLNIGGKVELWSDSEGGNIRLTSPNGSWWSIDAYGNTKVIHIFQELQITRIMLDMQQLQMKPMQVVVVVQFHGQVHLILSQTLQLTVVCFLLIWIVLLLGGI